ncbi:MAG: efflux RND transporter periplasmic adaptor subunit [Bacteroidetes bacterium]|nr:MAG: efflux RND transporter periplasmic adaptor subunit [Bacteroidota bacterium]
MKKILILVLVLVLAGSGWWLVGRDGQADVNPYRFVTIERGDLEAVVSATGQLEAVTTVQVGTQVSGIVSKIFVDFNDRVRQGQVIALIDTTLLASAVREAEANLERAQAQFEQAQREFERIRDLYEKQFATEIEYNQARYNYDVARATVKSARINLERAQRNLGYATIRAPISGVVVERNVDVGQTVQASFSAPQLFLIANDLARMQILASVDESDIGHIREGQEVRFSVQAYDDRTFSGTVRQVRLQSQVQENVVNYTVVVDVDNRDGWLLPGMTATVDFIIDRREDVLKVPNAALRFRPTEAMMQAARERMARRRENLPDSVRARMAERRRDAAGGAGRAFGGNGSAAGEAAGRRAANVATLWYLDEQGQPAMLRVRTGLTDGQYTEVSGPGLEEGMQVIAGVTRTSGEEGTTNPFQSNQGRRPPPGGF